jgi:PilZ domain-containing protein
MAEPSQYDGPATLTLLGSDHAGDVVTAKEGKLLFAPRDPDYLFTAGQTGELGVGDERGMMLVPVRVVETGLRLVLEAVGEARATQRREYVRVKQELPVEFDHESGTATGHTVDYSGGGFQVVFVSGELGIGDVADVVITLPDGDEVEAKAEILRRTPAGSFSCRFAEIRERQRDRLIREVFEAMRAQRAASR